MKYSIVTFGCRVNQADSSEMEAQLLAHGGESTDAQHADLVVVNTCSVTSASDQGARQIIRKIARENPTARIVVTGCYATRQPAELASLPGVVQVIPNDRKDFFAAEIGLTTAERFGDGDGACGAEIVPGSAGRTATRCECRPAATKRARIASSRPRAARAGAGPSPSSCRKSRACAPPAFVRLR